MALEPLQRHTHNGSDSNRIKLKDLETSLNLRNAPLAKVDAPSGGMTIDAEARTAINTIITRLEQLGLINEN